MDTKREEILANFQACTGLDDVAESITRLEETNWNLIEAVNRFLPQEQQTMSPDQIYPSPALSMGAPEMASLDRPTFAPISAGVIHPVSASNDIAMLPSTSNPRTRSLHFVIEVGDRVVPIIVHDSNTVGTIKIMLHGELGIPPCQQDLKGWKSSAVTDNTLLSSLNLPKENILFLTVMDTALISEATSNDSENIESEKLKQIYQLKVTDIANGKDYPLNFPGSKKIIEVKQDVFALTDIPVRHQIWRGWPESSRDENITLAASGIDFPIHNLTLERLDTAESKQGSSGTNQMIVDLTSDSSGEEFEDASESFGIEDDIFLHEVSSKKFQPLMPEIIIDDLDGVNHFISRFIGRYGENCANPMFYQGNLDDALKEAFHKPAKERKLLAIYLHHDSSVLSNVFCTQLLSAETVVSYLTTNFITWAWDLTFDSNRARLLAMVTQHFGSLAASTVRNFNLDQLPILLVIMRVRSTTEVFTVIHGNVSLDELLTRLIHAVEIFSGQQQVEIVEEDEREAREQVKREQDAAYEASLMADRAKDEARRLEEEVKQKIAQLEELEREKQEQARQREEAEKTALRKSLERNIPDEPNDNCGHPISQIRVRLPSGGMLSRKFLANTQLGVLLDYLTVKGYSDVDYKVLTSWPRYDLTAMDRVLTLENVKLYPQETITLEQR